MFPDHHPPCSLDYYNAAKKELSALNDNIIYVIFSDDIEWCKKEFNDPSYVISDLNSSFSWWGAWLNKKSDKIVIAPSQWFGKLLINDTSDIYCKNWIKI